MLLLFCTAAVTALAAHLLLRAVLPLRPWPERALAGALLAVTTVQFEVQALSTLPMIRPLRVLPLLHATVVALVLAWAIRRLGWREAWMWLRPPAVAGRWNGPEVMVASLLFAVVALTLAWGLVSGPTGVDELSYHVPQAALMHQNAVLSRPPDYLPWTYAYPQGAAMLWAFTMWFTGDDSAFHAVQVLFASQLLLAVYVLARRTGATRLGALLGALLLATAPVFFRMSTISTADMCFSAAVVTAVAYFAPTGASVQAADIRLALLACAQAASAKVPVVAVLLAGAALMHVLARDRLWRQPMRAVHTLRPLPDLAVLAVLLAASSTYLVNAARYGNPAWPLEIRIAGRDLPGPLPAFTDHSIGAQTTWGAVSHMSRASLWAASFFDWRQPLTEDSLGSFGPGIAVVGLALLTLAFFVALRRRDSWLLLLVTVCAIGVAAVPVLFVPRYALPVVAVMLAVAAVGLTHITRARVPIVLGSALVCVIATIPSGTLAYEAAHWYAANSTQPWYIDRGRSVAENVRLNTPETTQSPGLVRYIRSHVQHGQLVAWNITSYPTLMWNRAFSNRIEFVSGSELERYPTGPQALPEVSDEDVTAWASKIDRLHPDFVVVYTASRYVGALEKEPGWTIDYQDPKRDGPAGVTVLRREARH